MGDKEVHAFLKDVNLKVNVITQLELKPLHFEAAVQDFSHYITRNPFTCFDDNDDDDYDDEDAFAFFFFFSSFVIWIRLLCIFFLPFQ